MDLEEPLLAETKPAPSQEPANARASLFNVVAVWTMVILFGARAFWDPDETSRSSFMDVFFFAFLVSTALYLTFVGSITFMGRVAVWCCEEVRRTKAKLAQIPPTLNMPWQLGFWLDCIMNSFGVAAAVVIVVYAHLDVAIMCTHDTDASCEFLKNIYGLGVLGPVLFIAALGEGNAE